MEGFQGRDWDWEWRETWGEVWRRGEETLLATFSVTICKAGTLKAVHGVTELHTTLDSLEIRQVGAGWLHPEILWQNNGMFSKDTHQNHHDGLQHATAHVGTL